MQNSVNIMVVGLERYVEAEEKRRTQREKAFIPPVEEKPKKELKKKGYS